MTDHYGSLETRAPAVREELFSRLPGVLRQAMAAPTYAERAWIRLALAGRR
jgi:phenylacetate-CoA ligase